VMPEYERALKHIAAHPPADKIESADLELVTLG
jgi:hypothetical protein